MWVFTWVLLFSLCVAGSASDRADLKVLHEAGVQLKAGSSTPLETVLQHAGAVSGNPIELAGKIVAQVCASEDSEIPVEEFLKEILEPNGFVFYQDHSSKRVIVTRDLSRRLYPLGESLFRRLAHETANKVTGSEVAVGELLRRTLLANTTLRGISIRSQDTVYDLDPDRKELFVIDSRFHHEQIRTTLSDLADQQEVLTELTPGMEKLFQKRDLRGEVAASHGRTIYPDPEEGSISVVDTPEHLDRIEDYVRPSRSPTTWRSPDGLTRIIRVQHRHPAEMMLLLR